MNRVNLDIIDMGMRGNPINDIVDGWTFSVDEVSSNVYKIDGKDQNGHTVSKYGVDPIKVFEESIKDAQKIISKEITLNKIKSIVSSISRFGRKKIKKRSAIFRWRTFLLW